MISGAIQMLPLLLLVASWSTLVQGNPSYYSREYENRLKGYYYDTNPSYNQRGSSYYLNPYTSYPYSYKYTTYPTKYYPQNDDVVYVTDRYGRTSVTTGSSIRARYNGYTSSGSGYTGSRYTGSRSGYSRSVFPSAICTSTTCGENAQCTEIGGRPVCSCMRGYLGDPLSRCTRAECIEHAECRGHLACRAGSCVNPCEGACGDNAECEVRQHIPVCSCQAGWTGDPFSRCRRFNPEELCHPSPCGQNTQCEVVNNVPTCKCLPGFHGSPLSGCRHECESDVECGPSLACIDFKCKNPCSLCGKNAECEGVRNHVPSCKCPRGYFGNPSIHCQPECESDSDCPSTKPACFYNSCKNPCDGVCGIGANCELRGQTPVCSCPKDMTGNPFYQCRPFELRDLCEPNPCGANARCQPGYDRNNNERPVCTCLEGFQGDAISGCVRGECTADEHCPDNKACISYNCQNPCLGQCGVNANCNARRHIAVCTCPPGYNGDALTHCHLVPRE